ncbi:MAG: Gfo/Idh/MocA family oxidoreductase [Spirochaetia bacterium]|nr:Gfo/Idh/MocA family oxidoreductase [Spirochaetia bacterium]
MRSNKNLPSVAIIGAGRFAERFHFPALKLLVQKKEVRVTGVFDLDPARAAAMSKQFGLGKVYGSKEGLATDPEVEGIAVLVKLTVTFSVVKSLVPYKKPIFCEKPPGDNSREAKELGRIVKVPNVVAFNRRYTPMNVDFQKTVAGMKDIFFAEAHFYRHERTDDDFVRSTGIHAVNLMEFILGPMKLQRVDKWKNPNGKSFLWVAEVRFGKNARGLLKFFPSSGALIERIEVHSPASSAWLFSSHYDSSDYPGRIEIHEGKKVAIPFQGKTATSVLEASGFLGEWRDFLSTLRKSAETRSHFQNAWPSMALAEAIQDGVARK